MDCGVPTSAANVDVVRVGRVGFWTRKSGAFASSGLLVPFTIATSESGGGFDDAGEALDGSNGASVMRTSGDSELAGDFGGISHPFSGAAETLVPGCPSAELSMSMVRLSDGGWVAKETCRRLISS